LGAIALQSIINGRVVSAAIDILDRVCLCPKLQ